MITGQPLDLFERINLVPGLVGYKYCFDTFVQCRKWLVIHLVGNNLAALARQQIEEEPEMSANVGEI